MRKSKLSAEEIEAADKAADDRKRSRNDGFSMMHIRDRGWATLQNGVSIEWHVPEDKRVAGVPYRVIPPGHFVLTTNRESLMFEVDDFQGFMRWA